MQAYIGDVETLAFRMNDAEIAVTDQDKILALTMGLPNSYKAVIINFDSTPPNQLTYDHVITCLLNEETRQVEHHADHDEAMAVTSTPSARHTARAVSEITCYFCDARGHYKSDCPEKKKWEMKKKKNEEHSAAVFESSDSDEDPDYNGAF
jgi:Zinc knuckle.